MLLDLEAWTYGCQGRRNLPLWRRLTETQTPKAFPIPSAAPAWLAGPFWTPAITLCWDFVRLFTSLRIFNSRVQYPDHDIYLNVYVETYRPFHFMSTKYPDTTFITAFEIHHVNLITCKREQGTYQVNYIWIQILILITSMSLTIYTSPQALVSLFTKQKEPHSPF